MRSQKQRKTNEKGKKVTFVKNDAEDFETINNIGNVLDDSFLCRAVQP